MTNNEIVARFYHHDHTRDDEFAKKIRTLQDVGYVLDSLDVDNVLPLTPTTSGFVDETEIIETVQSLFSYLSGMQLYPVVYEGENNGKLLRHVVPREGMEKQISSYGSKESFLPHVDNPDLAIRTEVHRKVSPCPDTLSLLCLRQQEGVATSIIKLDDIISSLSHRDINLLQEECFCVSRPASFDKKSNLKNVPLLSVDKGKYISRFDYHNVFSENPIHQSALENFKKSSLDNSKWIELYLQPKQIITFDNQRVLHTRNGFVPKFDGFDRWLIRVFGLYYKPDGSYLISQDCNHHLSAPLFL